MYVCLCNALTDGQVKEAVTAGARRPRDVYEHCACNGQCGGCARTIQGLIRDHAAQPERAAAVP